MRQRLELALAEIAAVVARAEEIVSALVEEQEHKRSSAVQAIGLPPPWPWSAMLAQARR